MGFQETWRAQELSGMERVRFFTCSALSTNYFLPSYSIVLDNLPEMQLFLTRTLNF